MYDCLKPLIEKQTIRIDNHFRGAGVPNDISDKKQDVHIHKEFKDSNKQRNIVIKIPLQDNRDISFEGKDIPSRIRKEIADVLNDAETRNSFLKDVYHALMKDWKWDGTPKEQDSIANRIADAFGIKLSSRPVRQYDNAVCTTATFFLKDETSNFHLTNKGKAHQYKLVIDKEKGSSIGEISPISHEYIYI